MPDQFIHVSFPEGRTVFSADKNVGVTNMILRIDAGTHTFTLGDPKDYSPASQRLVVSDTSIGDPMEIAFSLLPKSFKAALAFAQTSLAKLFPAEILKNLPATVNDFSARCAELGLACQVEKNGSFGNARATVVLRTDPATNETWLLSALEQAGTDDHFHRPGGTYGELIISLAGQLDDVDDDGAPAKIPAESILYHASGTNHQPKADGFWVGLYHQPRGSTAKP